MYYFYNAKEQLSVLSKKYIGRLSIFDSLKSLSVYTQTYIQTQIMLSLEYIYLQMIFPLPEEIHCLLPIQMHYKNVRVTYESIQHPNMLSSVVCAPLSATDWKFREMSE